VDDEDRHDPVTAREVIRNYGEDYLQDALAFGWHYLDDAGNPYWLAGEWESITGLLEIEKRRDHHDNS
jgi:hypothetical protein